MTLGLDEAPLWEVAIWFASASAVVIVAGVALSRIADRLADRTGLGEAVMGGLFLGATTSLSGAVVSVASAFSGYPQLAVSNALGGIAAQTAFLGIADLVHRGVNLEHAAASSENLLQGTLLLLLLGAVLVAVTTPQATTWTLHPVSILMPICYVLGLRWVREAHASPMWAPRMTPETRLDAPDEAPSKAANFSLWSRFAVLALLVGGSGYVIARSGSALAAQTGLSETVVGTFFTAVSTSMPELITTVAAVRRGALTLAVSGIIGGNAYDVLFLAFADIAYLPGSIYAAMDAKALFLVGATQVMTATLLMGCVRREKYGPGNIGMESAIILAIYALIVVFMVLG